MSRPFSRFVSRFILSDRRRKLGTDRCAPAETGPTIEIYNLLDRLG